MSFPYDHAGSTASTTASTTTLGAGQRREVANTESKYALSILISLYISLLGCRTYRPIEVLNTGLIALISFDSYDNDCHGV